MKTFFLNWMQLNYFNLRDNYIVALARNFSLMLLLFSLCRAIFFLFNYQFFPDTDASQLFVMAIAGVRFDISALLWGNLIYNVLFIIPFKFRYNHYYQKGLKVLFVTINSILLLANCVDCVYFQFILKRTSADIFSEFAFRDVYARFGNFFIDFWLIWIIWIILTLTVYFFYKKVQPRVFENTMRNHFLFYGKSFFVLVLFLLLSVVGMRGSIKFSLHPIRVSDAGQYVKKPLEKGIVLNTPFSIFRTLGVATLKPLSYFDTIEALEKSYNPIYLPNPNTVFNPMNVVIVIWESLSREHVGALNKDLDNGNYKGYTPFLDSLIKHSLTFTSSYANGRKSVEALPSIMTSTPSFDTQVSRSSYAGNLFNSIPSLLKEKGYESLFFHGSNRTSLSLSTVAKMIGFDHFFSQEDYGTGKEYWPNWGVWDEEFLQFMSNKLSQTKQPFCSAIFTLTSHHPFIIPERYKDVFLEDDASPMLKCMRYTDFSLRKFFETASQQNWYNNTLFIITGDHASVNVFPESQNAVGQMAVPIIFFSPNSNLNGMIDNVAQQIDILPTTMRILNYDKEFITFGQDAIQTSPKDKLAVNFTNGIYQVFYKNYVLYFDGKNTTAMYDLSTDKFLKNNILLQNKELLQHIETKTKGFLQQHNNRMIDNCFTKECTSLIK
ncbi:MAG: LTA synthase family protein [Bacteroidales bacterium]